MEIVDFLYPKVNILLSDLKRSKTGAKKMAPRPPLSNKEYYMSKCIA